MQLNMLIAFDTCNRSQKTRLPVNVVSEEKEILCVVSRWQYGLIQGRNSGVHSENDLP